MKKALAIGISLAALSGGMSAPANAEVKTEVKQGTTAFGGLVVGAIAGGPPGAIVGMLTGIWLADEIGQADGADAARAALQDRDAQLARSTERVATLEQQLRQAQQANSTKQSLTASAPVPLELAMMFKTGQSTVTAEGKGQLNQLARYLNGNPELAVRLKGYADARGDANTNLALSKARAEAVAAVLRGAGVDTARLAIDARGDQAATGQDSDSMALERRVVIEIAPR